MRHTRNRQLRKINSFMASPFTLTIEDSKKHIWNDTLDKSFKWHRNWYSNKNYNILTWDSNRDVLGTTYHYANWGGLL